MIKKKFVVSGNYEEYRTFLHKHKDDINVVYQYVDSPRDLNGMLNIEGFYIGTYYKRHDIGAIKDMIKMSKLDKPVYPITDGYTVEHVTALDNSHVIDRRNYKELNDNAMIDSMRDRD
jgi:hypothetical protein